MHLFPALTDYICSMILVTGASGLVGLHLVQHLSAQQQKVRALYKTKIPALLPGTLSVYIEWAQCDILDIDALEKCFEEITQVYHCAAIVSYDPRMKDAMMEINVEGTAGIVNFCVEKEIEKLVYVSSIAAIGKEDEGTLITEKTIWNTTQYKISQYAISKQKAEMEVWRGIAEGLNAVIVNPAVILGEGDLSKSSTNLFKIVYDEFPYYTKGATAWVDVKEVIKALVLLMNSPISGERFILSAGNYSYKEIFDKMAVAMHKKPPYKPASPFMTELVWRISYLKSVFTGKTATITKETARNAHEINQFDNRKFLNAMPGFSYQPIDDTIHRVVKSLF